MTYNVFGGMLNLAQ